MPPTVVIAQLFASNPESKKNIIDTVTKVSVYSRSSEPDVTRYGVFLPEDQSDETSVWVIEEYATQAGLDAHMESQAVKDLIAYFGANPNFFGGPSNISTCEVSAAFTRPETPKARNPFVCHASIEYKAGKRAEALEAWKHVTLETEKNESETLSYGNYKDKEHAEIVRTLEIYSSRQYFKEVHVPSKAVQDNLRNFGNEIRVSIKHVILKLIAGYLAKEANVPNL